MGPSFLSCLVFSSFVLSCLILSCLLAGEVEGQGLEEGQQHCVSSRRTPPSSFSLLSFFICPASTSLALIAPSFLDLRCSWLAPTLCSIAPGLRSSVFPCTHSQASVRGPCFRLVLSLSRCGTFALCLCLRFRFVFSSRLALSGLNLRFLFVFGSCLRWCFVGVCHVPSLLGWSRAHAFGICLRFWLLASFSAFGFVLGFAFVISFCICFRLVLLLSVACLRCSCPLRVFPRFGLCPCSRLVPLLSACAFAACAFAACAFAACAFAACAFDLGLCFCTRLVPSLLRPGILSAFDFDF